MGDGLLNEVLQGTSFALFDGAMGSMLVREGLAAGELPELLCLNQPQKITAIHAAYVEAGSQFVTTNTFGANSRKLAGASSVDDIYAAAVKCARDGGARYVAADIGPIGGLMFPMGDLTFSQAYDLFFEQARAARDAGADLVIIETMADLLEMSAAVLAVKDACSLPVFATMTFTETGRTFLGTTPNSAALALAMLEVDALGVNCSAGPEDLQPVVEEMLAVSTCPVIVQANAGLPQVVNGQTVYTLAPEEYAQAVIPMIEGGASVLGGCCGTDPSYIRALSAVLARREPTDRQVNTTRVRELARVAADDDGRDAQIIAMIIENESSEQIKEALIDEYE